jgi:hypothetical protein
MFDICFSKPYQNLSTPVLIYASWNKSHIGGVMVCVLVSIVVDRGFELRSGQTKDYKIGICCFSVLFSNFSAISWGEYVHFH